MDRVHILNAIKERERDKAREGGVFECETTKQQICLHKWTRADPKCYKIMSERARGVYECDTTKSRSGCKSGPGQVLNAITIVNKERERTNEN
jgi:hypothetical protein